MDLHLKNKLVLITGSTGGIGKAIAEAFLEEGAHVILNGRSEEKVAHTIRELSEKGTVYGIPADVSDNNQCEYLIREVDKLGHLDILVNNMGIFKVKQFEEVSDEEWMYYFNSNVMSAVRLSRHFLPKMLENDKGRIINIASEAGIKPLPQMVPYSVSKSALIGLSRALAEKTKSSRVTVNSVLPGPTWTEGVREYMEGAAADAGEELNSFTANYFRINEPTSLIQRFSTVQEVADTVVFLGSDNASAINGTTQRVEGGIIRSI